MLLDYFFDIVALFSELMVIFKGYRKSSSIYLGNARTDAHPGRTCELIYQLLNFKHMLSDISRIIDEKRSF